MGENAKMDFTITNRGNRELIIDNIQSSCTCTGLEREQDDGTLARVKVLHIGPRKSAQVSMRVLVQGSPGDPTRNGVVFRTNDPEQEKFAIDVVVSKVNVGVSTVPTSIRLGTLPVGSESCQIVAVYDSAKPPRKIESVESLHADRVVARLIPATHDLTVAKHPKLGEIIGCIEISAVTDAPGTLTTDVDIHLVGALRRPTKISIGGRVIGPIEVLPSRLVLPRTSGAGQLLFGECICRSTTNEPISLRIREVPMGLSVKLSEVADSASQTVRIELNGDEKSEIDSTKQLIVELQAVIDGEEANFEIPVIYLKKAGS